MKKIVSFLLVISFLLAFTAFLPITRSNAETSSASSQAELEKIPSPKHINLYERIKKIGNALWGIKKADQAQEKLEKISSPKEIPLFEKIKKVGNALWGTRKYVSYRAIASSTAPCVIAAVEIKDKSLTDNNTDAVTKLNTAIALRTACQKTALGTSENQKKLLTECVRIFKDAHQQIKKDSKKTYESIWKIYRDSLKVCGKTASGNTASSTKENRVNGLEFEIEDGGGNITDTSEN